MELASIIFNWVVLIACFVGGIWMFIWWSISFGRIELESWIGLLGAWLIALIPLLNILKI